MEENEEDDSFLYLYRPRAVDFDAVQRPSELGSRHNIDVDTRTKITQKEFGGNGCIASIERVCYGTFNRKKAVVVVIRLLFHPATDERLFQHFEVQVSFEPRYNNSKSNTKDVQFPIVRMVFPRKAYGIPDLDGKAWSYKVEQPRHVSGAASNTRFPTSNVTRNASEAYSCLFITGRPWSDHRRREMYKACWVMKARGELFANALDEVNLAVVVECEDAFQANFKLTWDIPLYKKLLAFPWSEDKPIFFPLKQPGPFIGEGLRTTQFETLSDEEWAVLISNDEIKDATPEVFHVKETGLKTFRVRGIPAEYSLDTVSELLENVFGFVGQQAGIEMCSLALDIERHDQKVATISSSKLEAFLTTGEQWQKAVPNLSDGARPVKGRQIILDDRFYYFTPFAVPEVETDYLFDIIALCGLGGHAFASFKERDGNHMWLRDDLPDDFPHARILTYGYDTKLENSQSIQDLEAIATTFRTALKIARPKDSNGKMNDKPIIFIAHSLGGLVLKQALIQMADGDEKDKLNHRSIRGILFFGVPSQGMNIESLLSIVKGKVNEHFLQGLRPDSDMLRAQQREFRKKFPYRSCKIVSFYETDYSPTASKGSNGWKMEGEQTLLVGPASATSGSRAWEVGPNYCQPMKRNHRNMIRFHSGDPWYSVVKYVLNELIVNIERPDNYAGQREFHDENRSLQ